MPNQSADYRYWAVDFDRCLGNVDVLFNHYVEVLRDYHAVAPEEIIAARREVEASGGSFDLVRYLTDNGIVTDAELELAGKEYISRAAVDPGVLMPGAHAFLAYLESNYHTRYGIVTFGNPYWQRLKIAAAGLADMPCMVVNSAHKARQIASWYDETTMGYLLPAALREGIDIDARPIREVILVDDKPVAFDGLHEATRGYLVQAHGGLTADFMYGDRVDRVADLAEIITCEQSR